MTTFLLVAGCVLASALIVAWLEWLCRKPTYRELMRWQGNERQKAAYEKRRDALGHGTVRKVRDVPEPAVLMLTHEKENT